MLVVQEDHLLADLYEIAGLELGALVEVGDFCEVEGFFVVGCRVEGYGCCHCVLED